MHIIISAIGKMGSSPIKILIDEYLKRISWSISINEFQLKEKYKIDKTKEKESELLLSVCNNHFIITLDEHGKKQNSLEFASMIKKCQENNHNKIAFLIGGAHGHSDLVKNKSDLTISLSNMTFPHILARLILVEQIYRAYSINNNHPYHKI